MRNYTHEIKRTRDYLKQTKKMTDDEIKQKMPAEMEKYINSGIGIIDPQRHKQIIELYALKQLSI